MGNHSRQIEKFQNEKYEMLSRFSTQKEGISQFSFKKNLNLFFNDVKNSRDKSMSISCVGSGHCLMLHN